MRGRFIIIVVALAVTAPTLLKAQRISISTNLADYANFATFNIEGAYALNQHWSLFAKGAYNPFRHRRKGWHKHKKTLRQPRTCGLYQAAVCRDS